MRNPTVLVLLGLAVVWALVLTPDLVRMYRQTTSRRPSGLRSVTQPVSRRSNAATVGGYGAPARSGAAAVAPMSRTQAQQRRAMVLFALGVLCVLTLMGGVLMGGPVWVVHLALDVALVGYVYLLATRARNERASNAQRAGRAGRYQASQQRPSYLQQRPAPAAPAGGAVGEVYYLDDARPGNAVAGYVDEGYLDQPVASYEAEYAPVANYEAYAGDGAYYDDEPAEGYYEEWAEPQQQLRRSVGW